MGGLSFLTNMEVRCKLKMKNEFNYYNPTNMSELFEIIEDKKNTALLAGGTDLIVDMKHEAHKPDNIIDIKNIDELNKVEETDEGLYIGAAVTCNQFLNESDIVDKYKVLADGVKVLGSHQIRNRATIVGNVCGSSPGADTPPPLLTLNSTILIKSSNNEREVNLVDFFTGVKRNILGDNEIAVAIKVPEPALDGIGKYERKTRVKGPDLSACGVAGFISKEEKIVRFGYGAVAPIPKLIDASELFFEKNIDKDKALEELLNRVENTINPITDVRSTEKHRRSIAKVYTKRIFSELWEEGE